MSATATKLRNATNITSSGILGAEAWRVNLGKGLAGTVWIADRDAGNKGSVCYYPKLSTFGLWVKNNANGERTAIREAIQNAGSNRMIMEFVAI